METLLSTILKAVFIEAVPALIDLVQAAINADENAVGELRDQPISISISFGGSDGQAVVYQRTIEAKLPAGFALEDDSEHPPE